MALIVQKFGGTSVGDPEKIKNVAKRVLKNKKEGNQVVVILSAMSGETNRLTDFAMAMQDIPDSREMDVLLSSGEQVTISLFAMAMKALGDDCVSFLGDQVKILTDSSHTKARIESIDTESIMEVLNDDKVVVVAGFQGVDSDGNITTLGRGGSDTTAVALAAVLNADVCEIFTDVEGIYTADPNICNKARKIDRISYDEMLELASLGAKVLDIRSVTFAKQYHVPIHVRSTFTDTEGTWVVEEEKAMEGRIVSGVTYNKSEARITISGVPDQPGIATKIFTPISNANIIVDMIIQNQDTGNGMTDMTFTVLRSDYERTLKILGSVVESTEATGGIHSSDAITKISIVGVGMRNHSGIASTMFSVLANEGINISMISTSEIKVSCIINEKYTELAVRALHDAFELDKDNMAEEETLV
ncbi:MAG: aspartate kinase [Desulfocapsa sp.]|uniref:Aspartokinase n=1 Tax=Desulfotalea psychrophila TaxID=84980 RepID=A0ABS3AX47_9BACT|nr:aspartate kinase [Desulfocapsa sp.]MBN4067915.1 aspartate kinase [Desulfotalea psychrophila]